MLTQAVEVMRYVKASAGRSSLRVVFEEGNMPRHDGNTIYLPRITKDTTEPQLLEMMASTDHEVAHDLYSDFGILREKGIDPMKSPLGFIWNLVEDSRVNALEAKDYEGFRELWDQTNPELLERVLKNTKDGKGLDQVIQAMIKWETSVSSELFPMGAVVGKSIKGEEKLDAILNSFTPRLEECQEEYQKKQGTQLTYNLARDIFKALGGDPDKEEEKAKQQQKEAEGKEGKEGDKEETKAESGEGEAKAGDEIEEGKTGKFDDEDWCIKKIVLKDLDSKLPTVHTIDGPHMSKVGLLYDVAFTESYDWSMPPLEDFIKVDYVNNTCSHGSHTSLLDTSSRAADWFTGSFNERVRGKAITSENFAQQVRRLIQIRSRVKYQYGVKKGKLDQARLSRIAIDSPGFNERVFKNKISNTVLDAAVTILLDMSGSMSGDKVFFSCESTVLLNSVFQVLQVPLEIIGFTDQGDLPISYIYKPFSKLRLSSDDLISYIGASSAHMTGNPDGDSILWTYDRLLKRKERKRLLIVMSDGQPAASRDMNGCPEFTLKAIREIEALKKVEIYGLGICDFSVKEYYKHNSTVRTPQEIPQRLLELIEKKLLNA